MKPIKENRKTPHPDDLDHILDGALAKYTAVEPRTGLEERVLANLRSAPLSPFRQTWLQWGLAAGLAAIAVVGVLVWRSSQVPHHIIANHPPAVIQGPSIQAKKTTPSAKDEVAVEKQGSTRKLVARRSPASTTIATRPMLDQFPSPQPLSPEEIALARYVKNFPKEAQLVARAQEEYALETQRVMNDAGAETPTSGSIQQER